jgi:hypothetical protein
MRSERFPGFVQGVLYDLLAKEAHDSMWFPSEACALLLVRALTDGVDDEITRQNIINEVNARLHPETGCKLVHCPDEKLVHWWDRSAYT